MIRKKLIVGNHVSLARQGALLFIALAGTVAVTNGSDALVGTTTAFTGLSVGQTLSIPQGGVFYQFTVSAIADDTHLTLSAEWAGDTAAAISAFKSVAGTSSSSISKPATTVPANWTGIGSTLDLEVKNKTEDEEVYEPSPGAYDLSDVITKSRSVSYDCTIQDGGPELFEMLFLANGAISSAYTPLSGTGKIYAWWQVKQYDQTDTLINLVEVWGIGTVEAQKFENKLVRYKLNIRALVNSLNNGTLSLA